MNVLIVVDKPTSAIDRLAQGIAENTHIDVMVSAVHPKRPDAAQLEEVSRLLDWADVLDVHYWRSGEVIRNTFPESFERIKKVVCHFNPYDLDKEQWNGIYDEVVVGNESMRNELAYARLIPYMVDLNRFKYSNEIPEANSVLMVASRIEGKKGILPVAQACKKLGVPFKLVGRISSAEYFEQVKAVGGVTYYPDVTDNELVEHYHSSSVLVCNSVDGFESGTLPILEAMACGTPVLTREIGHVPDLADGKNMVINHADPEDVEGLAKLLGEVLENREWRDNLKQGGWKSVKSRPIQKMAKMYYRLYMRLWAAGKPLASVIIPTKDNHDAFVKCIAHAITQDYEGYEIVVVDSGKKPVSHFVDQFKSRATVPIKYFYFDDDGYTLPKARNIGVLEADGEILIFCDDRIGMASNAVTRFVRESRPKTWLYGVKDGVEKPFVENFSSIVRSELLRLGGFNERIDGYGGASQELRTRFHDLNAFDMRLVNDIHAESVGRSHGRSKKRQETWRQKYNLFKLYG